MDSETSPSVKIGSSGNGTMVGRRMLVNDVENDCIGVVDQRKVVAARVLSQEEEGPSNDVFPLNALPHFVLSCVFDWLPLLSQRQRLRRVCKVWDRLLVQEFWQSKFLADVTNYPLKQRESIHYPNKRDANLLQNQRRAANLSSNGVSDEMFCILVGWLSEVREEFKSSPRSLSLGVSLLMRWLFQSEEPVHRTRFQCLGSVCYWLASKIEDIYPPELPELAYISDFAYNISDIREMELSVLKLFKFRINMPCTLDFFELFVRATEAEAAVTFDALEYQHARPFHELSPHELCGGPLSTAVEEHGYQLIRQRLTDNDDPHGDQDLPIFQSTRLRALANYLAELALQSFKFNCELPSFQAACIVLLTRIMTGMPAWSARMTDVTHLTNIDSLISGARIVHRLHRRAQQTQATRPTFDRHKQAIAWVLDRRLTDNDIQNASRRNWSNPNPFFT